MRLTSAFLSLLLVGGAIHAAPPTFDPPTEIPIVSGIAIYKPPADCVSVTYIGLDGEEEFPLDLVGGSKTAFAFFTRGLPAGKRYRFVGVASSATGEQVEKLFVVVVPGAPVKPPPIDPPAPSAVLYFLVVSDGGPADPALTKIMSLPAWNDLRAAGHSVWRTDKAGAAALRVNLPPNTALPVVVTLRVSADGKSSTIVRGPVALPTTADGIAKLPEGVK